MSSILLYIQGDQVEGVFEREDVGSGQTSFAGLAEVGNRVYVASEQGKGLCIVGEIPVDEKYVDEGYQRGWKYRVRATKGTSIRYGIPVQLKVVKDELSFLRGKGSIWNQVRNARRLPDEDAALLSRLGRGQ